MFSKFLLAVLRISCPSDSVNPHLFICFLFLSISFCVFSLVWGLKGINPTPSPSHNINRIQESCLINHTVFHIHQWSSLCHAHFPPSGPTQGCELDSTCSSRRTNCYNSSLLLFLPDEGLCLLEWAFLRKNLPVWSELCAVRARDLNRWATILQLFRPSHSLSLPALGLWWMPPFGKTNLSL